MYDLRNPAIDDPLDRVRPQKKEHIVHPSNWLKYNPFYDLFYSTTNMAATVAVILLVALFVALARRHKAASIGIGIILAQATAAAVVLNISDKQIDATFANHMSTRNYGAPVTGVQFVGTPIVMAIAAVGLFVLAGRFAWVAGRTVSTKLTIVTAFLLGASLFGTFAAQLAQDMYDVAGYNWTAWSDLGNWLWAADFILTCAVLAFGLINLAHRASKTTRIQRIVPTWRAKLHRSANAGRRPQKHTTITRTADASA